MIVVAVAVVAIMVEVLLAVDALAEEVVQADGNQIN